ncbi:Fic family protein [Olivibacter domesticus]|uniref:Fic/DOC family protein n=1 Tax=Olivibacter domesticus TaxID=407022 RepID=A0A1H7IDX3_OLID1|nr:Fic family protein [Olivibacter domesticus]SEK59947.1 Fic/DOC family protein [Olivibacter domesticus]
MPSPGEKLAVSLEALKELQDSGVIAIKSGLISRTNRERLVKNGYLQEIVKGWYIASRPEENKGESYSWYSSFWEFCSELLTDRYGEAWAICPEQSLELHAGNTAVPRQLLVRAPEGGNHLLPLPFGTSLFTARMVLPAREMTEVFNGMRVYSLPAALVHCSANTFNQSAITMRTALAMIRDSSEVLRVLLEGGHSTIAGRLAGAFRNIGQQRIADEIIARMKGAGYDVREVDPFSGALGIVLSNRERSPYINRIRLLWSVMRETVIAHFPIAPGLPEDREGFLQQVDQLYETDAYHSLSIERYRVSAELIERVRSGNWDHQRNEEDRRERNAMAARGYYLAYQEVEKSVRKVLDGRNAGEVADTDHGVWYQQLFEPSVGAGILRAGDLAGYRSHQVYIGGSMHVPLNVEALREVMPVFFELLGEEPEASVRAVLGHFLFGFIHPYMDGNGRMARLLMNVMLASGGYPWTVIPVEQRAAYMSALESASVEGNIRPFATFIGNLVQQGMQGRPVAQPAR